MAHLFICPNCGQRSATDRQQGSATSPRGSKCGFGFLFELLDDYYPAPNAAFFVCDQNGRIIGCGRGSRELTGLSDEKVMGREVREVLGLDFEGGPTTSAPSWSGECASSASRSSSTPRRSARESGRRSVSGVR